MIIHGTQKAYYILPAVVTAKRMLFAFCTLLLSKQMSFSQELAAPHSLPATAAWQQNIFVHVNKGFFVAGEQAWFSVFTTDASSGQPTDLEKIAFIEIFSHQRAVLQTTVPLRQGRGWGTWSVPDTLSTGNYLLRAYTSAMKNIGQAAYFEMPITIVNTSRQPSWAALQKPPALHVALFPEGGKLVYGQANTTAIRCSNQYGEGLEANGAVINQNKDTVARFNTCCGGRAVFSWTPKKEEQYTIAVQSEEQKQQVALAQPLNEGITMAAKALDAGKIEITIQASGAYLNQNLLLVAGADGHRLQTKSGRTSVVIAEDDLPGGLANLLLYDEKGTLHSNRWWYRKPPDALNINVQLAQSAFETRQEVKVSLTTQSGNAKATPADLSISVYRLDSLQGILQRNINNPTISNTEGATSTTTDLLCRTFGPPYNSTDGSTQSLTPITFLPQFEGPQVLALVTDQQTSKPAAGINAFLTVPAKQYQFIPAVSDSLGILRFNLKNFTGSRKIIFSSGTGQAATTTQLLSIFDPQPPLHPTPRFWLPEAWAAQLQQHSLTNQLASAFKTTSKTDTASILADTTVFFGVPDKAYLLDDYTRFPTLEEVLKEYVPEVMVRKRNNRFHYRVFNEPYKQYFDQDPLVLVDGVPVFDINALMAADPLKIKKLEVVTRRFAKGLDLYEGIVSFSTYAGNLDGVPLFNQTQTFQIAGSLPEQTFGWIDYSNKAAQHRIPDQRLQLCWLPSLHSDARGMGSFSFFTSDVGGKYAIVIQGLSADGTTGSHVHYFEVKAK